MHPFAALATSLMGLAFMASADASCRCGSYEFLSIPRVNFTAPHPSQVCVPYSEYCGTKCHNYLRTDTSTELLDARGTLEPQNLSLMFQLPIKKILANATDMATSQSVIYPAELTQNVTSGVQHLKDTIDSGLQNCPDQKYFLFGYSQGATLVLETLEKLNKASTEAVAGVVLVGNPYRLPGRRSNVNRLGERDCRQNLGRFATQAKKENGTIPMISNNLDASGRVLDICLDVSWIWRVIAILPARLQANSFQNDTLCAASPKCQCPIDTDHLSYGMSKDVQDLIFKHVTSLM